MSEKRLNRPKTTRWDKVPKSEFYDVLDERSKLINELAAERELSIRLYEALQGWARLDEATEAASGRVDDPAVQEATAMLDITFEEVWAARDAAMAAFRGARGTHE